jgi:hypothetical protein
MRQIVHNLSGRYGRVLVSAGVAVAVVLGVSLAVALAGSRQVPGAHAASAVSTPVNYMVANLGFSGGNEQSPVTCIIGNNNTANTFPIASFSWSIKPSAGGVTSSPVVFSAPADWYTPLIEINLATSTVFIADVCSFNFNPTTQTYTRVEDYSFSGCQVSGVSSAAKTGAVDTFTLTCGAVTHTVYFGHNGKFTFICQFNSQTC